MLCQRAHACTLFSPMASRCRCVNRVRKGYQITWLLIQRSERDRERAQPGREGAKEDSFSIPLLKLCNDTKLVIQVFNIQAYLLQGNSKALQFGRCQRERCVKCQIFFLRLHFGIPALPDSHSREAGKAGEGEGTTRSKGPRLRSKTRTLRSGPSPRQVARAPPGEPPGRPVKSQNRQRLRDRAMTVMPKMCACFYLIKITEVDIKQEIVLKDAQQYIHVVVSL